MEGIRFDAAYANLFFTCIADNGVPPENRLGAALFFKNAVTKYWNPDDTDGVALDKAFGEDTKRYIKDNLAKLLMMSPRKIGESLADIANVIGKVQLKTEWPQFLPVRSFLLNYILIGITTRTSESITGHTLRSSADTEKAVQEV